MAKKNNEVEPTKISEYETKIEQADGIITKSWDLLKKHWGKLLIFSLIYGCYRFVVLVVEETEKPKQEQVVPVEVLPTEQAVPVDEEIFVVREYDEEQTDGTIVTIEVWSDSVETVKK